MLPISVTKSTEINIYLGVLSSSHIIHNSLTYNEYVHKIRKKLIIGWMDSLTCAIYNDRTEGTDVFFCFWYKYEKPPPTRNGTGDNENPIKMHITQRDRCMLTQNDM